MYTPTHIHTCIYIYRAGIIICHVCTFEPAATAVVAAVLVVVVVIVVLAAAVLH